MSKTVRQGVRYHPRTGMFFKSQEQNKRESKDWLAEYDTDQQKKSDVSKLTPWERMRYE